MLNLNDLKQKNDKFDFWEKRPGVFKVLLPYFYEDGDMYDVFIEEIGSNIRISDYGLTLMKLSYNFDINTPKKKEVLNDIIMENRCKIDNDNIYLDVTPKQFETGIKQFVQALTKVSTVN